MKHLEAAKILRMYGRDADGKLFGEDYCRATPQQIRGYAADMLRDNHPDHGGDGSQIGKIKLARDVLLRHLEDLAAVTKCSVCEGEGRVKTPRGPKKNCPTCGGSGETRRRE